MPRIYDSANIPLDFHRRCFPSEETAGLLYGIVAKTGEGPDGRGNCFSYDSEHPPYEDGGYRCLRCGKPLKEGDN